jgi:DNA-binding NarL/FixJ family response regulator
MNMRHTHTNPAPTAVIADAFDDIRTLIHKNLQDALPGWKFIETSTAKETVEKCTTLQPDVVVAEASFPDGNGFEVVERIRVSVPHAQIYLVGAFDSGAIRRAAERTGCVAFINKGRIHEELIPLLRERFPTDH